MGIDFLAIGDTVVDDFIRLKDARVDTDADEGDKGYQELCFRFGDKVPFEFSQKVYGVGNAANAAVAAARLGLATAFVANVGKDEHGEAIVRQLKKEKVSVKYVWMHRGLKTNYHYVLWYGNERTILVNHIDYPYTLPKNIPAPKTVYFSSVGAGEEYHNAVTDWLEKNPKIRFAFQPGTFQMEMGVEKLKRLYQRTDIFFCNKQEYERILGVTATDMENHEKMLLDKMRALGPKVCVLTDGPRGVWAREEAGAIRHFDMYPDPKPPLQRTGAGDAFSSTTAAYLTMGLSLPDAITRGLVNAAYVVQEIGAQKGLLTKKELEIKLAPPSAT